MIRPSSATNSVSSECRSWTMWKFPAVELNTRTMEKWNWRNWIKSWSRREINTIFHPQHHISLETISLRVGLLAIIDWLNYHYHHSVFLMGKFSACCYCQTAFARDKIDGGDLKRLVLASSMTNKACIQVLTSMIHCMENWSSCLEEYPSSMKALGTRDNPFELENLKAFKDEIFKITSI